MASRRARLGLLMLAAALAAVALVAVLLSALAAPGLRQRWDWSRLGAATLSSRTAAALQALPDGSKATAFLVTAGEDPRLLVNGSAVYQRAYGRLRALLEDARVRSRGRLEVEILDDRSSLVELQQARERLERQPGETVIFETPTQRRVLRFPELFLTSEPDYQNGAPARIREERVDDAFGDAALALGRERLPRIGLVRSAGASAARPLEDLGRLLRAEGYEPVVIDGPERNEDLDLLVVAGQDLPWRPQEAEALAAWVAAGRPLLVALDAFAAPPIVAAWNEAFAPLGLRWGDGLVCEGQPGNSNSAVLAIQPQRLSSQHPVTRNLVVAGRGLVLQAARPLLIEGGNNVVAREALARTGKSAWLDLNQDFAPGSREPQQEATVAVAAERWSASGAADSGRTLALGSAAPLYGQGLLWNRDLLAQAFHWLLYQEDGNAGLAPVAALPFRPAPAAAARIHNLSVFALPGATLLLGFLVYWRRRR